MELNNIEIPNYLKLIENSEKSESVAQFYGYLCKNVFKSKQLFTCLWPLTNVYMPSMVKTALINENTKISTEIDFEKEINNYCEYFIKGYSTFWIEVNNNIEFNLKYIFSTIIAFPYSHSLIPYFTDENEIIYPNNLGGYGEIVGKYYCAWCIVLKRQTYFEPLFKENSKQQTETKTEQESENDFTLSTIEDWLFEFKDQITEPDYKNLISALTQYLNNGTFPTLTKVIQINGKPNKKLFGWALNRIFEAKGKGIEKELLLFAKQNISLFIDVKFDEKNIFKSNLYKYFTTKTK